MAQKLYEETNIQAIADAIRAKNGKTTTYKPSEMAVAIGEIPSSSGDTAIEDALVTGDFSNVGSVYENNRVTAIKFGIFYEATHLTKVIAQRITRIGRSAFAHSTVQEIDAPLLTTIGYGAFRESAIININAPLLTNIDDYCFYGCTAIKEVDFSLVSDIGTSAFYSCSALTKVTLSTITKLSLDTVFWLCTALKELNAPKLTTISGSGVFKGCTKLAYVDFPVLTYISSATFEYSALETLILRSETLCTLSMTNALGSTPIAKGTGYIYVPSALIEEYKVATNWATYADRFRAIEDYPDICGGT